MDLEDWTERDPRDLVAIAAEVEDASGKRSSVMLDNLSDDGCCLIGSMAIGERVALHLQDGTRLAGQVRWAIGGRTGVRFDPEGEG